MATRTPANPKPSKLTAITQKDFQKMVNKSSTSKATKTVAPKAKKMVKK